MFTQTDKVFAALIIGFIIYITVRGQLPQWFQLFTSSDAAPKTVVNEQKNKSSSNNPLGFVTNLFGSSDNSDPLNKAANTLADALGVTGDPSTIADIASTALAF